MSTPGIPDYADKRAHKFYSRVYVGSNLCGANALGYKMSWDSDHDELKEVETLGRHYCGYCGNRPLPIQAFLWKEDYSVTGYTCVCSDAMDAIEVGLKIEALKELHRKQLRELEKKMPKHKDSIKVAILQNHLERSSGSSLDSMLNFIL